jgi:hypothetical protein
MHTFLCIFRIMGKAGGLSVYTEGQSKLLLFWSLSSVFMLTYQNLNVPRFDRDDMLNPEFRDSHRTWCVPAVLLGTIPNKSPNIILGD